MDILIYLTELLQTHKSVGIVGLGTVYKKKSPGKYDVEKHAFIPPSYNLNFTSEVEEEEELANYISQKRNITIESALYYIGEFADQIQAQLAANQEADLKQLGKLKLVNDKVVLLDNDGDTFGFDSFGLPTINEINIEEKPINDIEVAETLNDIEEENKLEEENPGQESEIEEDVLLNDEQETFEEITEVKTNQEQVIENTFVTPSAAETIHVEEKEVQEETALDYIEEEEPKKGMPFLIKVLIILLVIISAGAVAYFINPAFFNKYLNNYEGKQDKNIPVAPIDSLSTKTDSLLADSLKRNNEMVNLASDTPTIDSSKLIVHEVLVSAVKTEKIANKIIANLAKEGIVAKKINLNKTKISISAGTFLNETAAKTYRDSLRIALKNPGIYIKSIKPKTHKN